MAKVVQIRRGTSTECDAKTGLLSEIFHDTTDQTLRINDGSTQGGTKLLNHKLLVSELLDLIYPVGAIYMSMNNVSPANFLGGTWELLPVDRFLVAAGGSYAAGDWGGANTHTITLNELPAHSHSGWTDEQGLHTHDRGSMEIVAQLQTISGGIGTSGAFYNSGTTDLANVSTSANALSGVGFQASRAWTGNTGASGAHSHNVSTNDTGGGAAMDIRPQYYAVFMWKRTA